MRSRRARLLVAAAVVLLLAVLGFLWLKVSTDSYDQRYTDCMRIKGQGHYWPDDAYNAAMRECERQAGLSFTTVHPNPFKP